MAEFAVAEKFVSINGEGLRAGQPSVFIRFRGCDLRCSYCDTAWAQEESCPAEMMSAEDILGFIRSTETLCCTLTGGEPVLRRGFSELCALLLEYEPLRIEIETNGSAGLQSLDALRKGKEERLAFTMDYKLPSSGMEKAMLCGNFDCLTETDCVKFVCGDNNDLIRAKEIIEQYGLNEKCQTLFSPVFGSIEPAEMVNFILQNKLFKSRMQLQLHKFIWDPQKRGV